MAYQIEVLASDSVYIYQDTPNTPHQTANIELQDKLTSAFRFSDQQIQGKVIKDAYLQIYIASATLVDYYHFKIYVYSTNDTPLPQNLAQTTYPDLSALQLHLGSSTFLKEQSNLWLGKYNDFLIGSTSPLEKITRVMEKGLTLPTFGIGNQGSVTIPSSTGAYPPKLIVTVENATTFSVVGTRNTSGLMDKTKPLDVGWEIRQFGDIYGRIKQGSALLRYRDAGATSFTDIAIQGDSNQYTIPANTFTGKFVEWQIVATTTDGWSATSELVYRLSTEDSLSTAQIISPKAQYLTGNEPNTFAWQHIIATGTAQTKAELQTSTDGTTWTALLTHTGAEQHCTVLANTLTGGSLFWRARTYNRDGVAGAWSEAAPIMVYAAPKPPSLNVQGTAPKFTLMWQSAEQKAYQVKAGDWTSTPIFGTAKQMTIPKWLPDGNTVVGVRVQSSIGLWSEWATTTVTIANVPQEAIQLSTRSVNNGAYLTWDGTVHDRYIVYRDGKPIHATTGHSFTDWFAIGKHQYQVRGVKGDYYALSNYASEITSCRFGAISDVDNIDWLPLKYKRESPPTHSATTAKPMNMVYCNGRTKPVAEVSEHRTHEHTFEFSFRDFADAERLKNLLGKTVVYKDNKNSLVIGVITSVSGNKDILGEDVSFGISETDWKEVGADYY